MLEYFRGVIWPRGETKKETSGYVNHLPNVYRYVVMGMLVTDKPIEGIEGKNEVIVDGSAISMADILKHLPQKEAAFRLGDANMVLTNLAYLVKE